MDTKDRLPPFLIEVNQEDIKDILTVLEENDMLKLIKVTTILGDDYSPEEIDEVLLNRPTKKKCEECSNTNVYETCKICEKYYCGDHLIKCQSCKNYVCDNDTTISFEIYHNGQVVCKTCN